MDTTVEQKKVYEAIKVVHEAEQAWWFAANNGTSHGEHKERTIVHALLEAGWRPPCTDSEGALRIAAERQRQTEAEGWTDVHDDEHDKGELLSAAESYIAAITYDREDITEGGTWPWEPEGFKPSDDPIRNLVKAGALIAAEIDRLHRKKLGLSD